MTCAHGSEPIPGTPAYVWINGADAIPGDWLTTIQAIGMGTLELISTDELCANDPPPFATFGDTFNPAQFRAGMINNAKAMKWFEVCRCKAPPDPPPDPGCAGIWTINYTYGSSQQFSSSSTYQGFAADAPYLTREASGSCPNPSQLISAYDGRAFDANFTCSQRAEITSISFEITDPRCLPSPPDPPPDPPSPPTPPPTVEPPPPGMCSCNAPPVYNNSYYDMSFTESDRSLLQLIGDWASNTDGIVTEFVPPLPIQIGGIVATIQLVLDVVSQIIGIANGIKDLLDETDMEHIKKVCEKILNVVACNRATANIVSYARCRSMLDTSLNYPIAAVVQLEQLPNKGKEQSGGGLAPDVYYAGWIEWLAGGVAYPRQPIHFISNYYEAPCQADGFAVTFVNGAEGSIIILEGNSRIDIETI